MKRFAVTGVTRDKVYDLTPGKPGTRICWFSANPNGEAEVVKVILKPKPRLKTLQFDVDFSELAIKGKQSLGNIVTRNEVHRFSLKEKGTSTLGGRKVWFDRDVLRLNYDGRGDLLGEFFSDDRILVVMQNGDFFITTFDAENHYDEGIIRIEKYRPGIVWTAVLNDADQGYPYIKRFTMDASAKHQRMIGENPKSQLLILTDEKYPRFEVKFGEADSFREPMVIDAEQFIGVKSFKAKGKRVSNWSIAEIKQIEPREVDEEQEIPQPQPATDGEVEVVDSDSVIDQGAVRDALTGQMRMFDEDEFEDEK